MLVCQLVFETSVFIGSIPIPRAKEDFMVRRMEITRTKFREITVYGGDMEPIKDRMTNIFVYEYGIDDHDSKTVRIYLDFEERQKMIAALQAIDM
jgi:hypothetical protein